MMIIHLEVSCQEIFSNESQTGNKRRQGQAAGPEGQV